jgi:hypothetical protein
MARSAIGLFGREVRISPFPPPLLITYPISSHSTFPFTNEANPNLIHHSLIPQSRHGHRRPLHRRINLRHHIRREFTKLALRRTEHIYRPTTLCRKPVSANPKLHVSFVYADRRCGSLSLYRTCNPLPYPLSRRPKAVYICANVMDRATSHTSPPNGPNGNSASHSPSVSSTPAV